MITLNFDVNDQTLTRQDENTVAANSRLVHTCEFTFSSEWDGRGKVATFKKRDLMLSVIVDDTTSSCVLPPEILQSENKIDVFELSICGADGNSTITSTIVRVPILAGTWDPFTEEITPTLFEQIMQKIDEIEKGEVSPELIYEAVTEYMEAHPLEPIIADDVAAYFAAHAEELKGDKGDTGATPSITATAEVNNAVGTPSVTVTKTGTTEAPNLNFAFQNLKGAKGDTGATPTISAAATVDNTTGTPTVNVSKTGTDAAPEFTFAFSGLKGAKGDPGTPGDQNVWGAMGKLGAKNLLKFPYYDGNKTANGVTYTINDDTSILVASAEGATNYAQFIFATGRGWLPEGNYIMSVQSLLTSGVNVQLIDRDDGQRTIAGFSSNTLTKDVIITETLASHDLRLQFNVAPGTICNDTVYLMLRLATDTDTTWQPYAMTNQEITDVLKKADGGIIYKGIVCWGDSLTAGGGWTTRLAELSGLDVYNAGTGGEGAQTIMARQGGDIMETNNITIPAAITPVTIATRAEGGINTEFGKKAMPLLQGGTAHVNPVMIGNVKGQLAWTGADYADQSGTWTFTREAAGAETVIDRPTAIRTAYDRTRNKENYIMIVFMGQNGGYSSIDDLVNMHKLMIDHFEGKEYVVLGLSSGSADSRADYEAAMREAFGRRFISLREYLAHPIYENGQIVSCYGLADQGLTPGSVEYNGVTYVALDEIAQGIVPHQILADSVHYTAGTKTVIGNMLYKKMQELNILA